MSVGILGVGIMGGGFATALAANEVVAAFDTDGAAVHRVPPAVTMVSEPRELAACEYIIVALPGPIEAEAALLGEGGMLRELAPNTVVIDTTTSGLATTRRLATAAEQSGVAYVDAPVSGRPPRCTVLLGGAPGAIERIGSILNQIADRQFVLGPSGSGTIAKLLNQYLTYANFLMISQAVELAERSGLRPDELVAALGESSAASRALEAFRRNVICTPPSSERRGSIGMINKDLQLATQLDGGANLLGLPDAAETFAAAVDAGRASSPFPEIARLACGDAGLRT